MTRAALALACLAMAYSSTPAAAAERLKIGGDGLEWESNSLVFNALEVTDVGGLSPLEADPEEKHPAAHQGTRRQCDHLGDHGRGALQSDNQRTHRR